MLKSLSRDLHLRAVVFLAGTWSSVALLTIAFINGLSIRWELGMSLASGFLVKPFFFGLLTLAFGLFAIVGILLLAASPRIRIERVIWASLVVCIVSLVICVVA